MILITASFQAVLISYLLANFSDYFLNGNLTAEATTPSVPLSLTGHIYHLQIISEHRKRTWIVRKYNVYMCQKYELCSMSNSCSQSQQNLTNEA